MTERRPTTIETFRVPSRDYGILPFWFLNGELDPDEMRFQLSELRDKGMQGIIFHGRFGLEMPYVGDTYLDRIRLGVEEAKRLGLTSWVYDEMNWPSGTADKRVLAERPDLSQRYIECISFSITGPWFMFLTGEDSRYLDFERSTPVAAFAIGEDDRVIDLTPNLSFEKVVPWEVPPGTWRLCYIVEKRADYYIDALDPESTETFLRLGYDPYAKAIGDPLSDRLVGFYSDEPAMHYYLSAGNDPIVPWTKDMFGRFKARNGYDLRPRLVHLFFDLGPEAAKVRHDFYRTLTEFYSRAYYAQIRDWCRERGVVFTAHLLYEEWLRGMIRVEGNLFEHYRNMDVVAVDHLYPVIGTREAPEQHVAIKVASSAAHQVGSERLICESFGGIFMDATMQRMKWIADWEFVLGVNVLNPHGFHYTLEGPRKRDWPPSMFYQYPWWRYYGSFSEYMSRLSEMLTGGRHVAKVAVLWPIDSMFATYLPQERTEDGNLVELGLNRLTDILLRLHHDFDYLDERALVEADLTSGRLRIRDEEYELLIVPPMTHAPLAVVETMERFTALGGCVLGVLSSPRTAFGPQGLVDVGERLDALVGTGGGVVEHPGGGRGAFVAGDAAPILDGARAAAPLMDGLRSAIDALIEPDVTISNEELFCLHRVREGRDVYFIVNPTQREQRATMSISTAGHPQLWDPSTGGASALHLRREGSRTAFDVVLPPVGSAFVVAGDPEDGVAAAESVRDEAGAITLEGPWSFEAEDDNALVIKTWRATPELDGADDESYATGPTGDWLSVVAGAWAYQFPTEPDRPFPIPVWYRASFEVAAVPERLALIVDGFDGSDDRVYLNGARVDGPGVRARFDAQMRELDLSRLVVPGTNQLAIRLVVEGPTGGIVDHLKLVGSFALDGDAEDGFRLAEPVSEAAPAPWTQQGYPFYSGTGVYRTRIEAPSPGDLNRLLLEIPMGDDVVEVEINGRSAGVRLWEPYALDVTDLLRPGENEVSIRVANTIANLLNGVDRPSGIAGAPRLVPFTAGTWVAAGSDDASARMEGR